jgi:hypothetical protein
MRPALALLSVLVALACELTAQIPGAWVEVPFSIRPFARHGHGMVFDVARNESVLFGGNNGAYMNDTWVLGTTGWTRRLPAASPPARSNHAMAYDPIRQRTVLIGGTNGNALTDIWEWDGVNWSQLAAGVPGLDAYGSATYDPLLGGVFYNRNSINLLWNGVNANTLTVPNPASGTEAPMVFHAAAGGALRRWGQGTYRFTLAQGWEAFGLGRTFSVRDYAIAADPVRNRVFLQGGDGGVGNSSGSAVGHTWEWGGGSLWEERSDEHPLLADHAMVFDFGRDAFVIFGGRRNQGGDDNRTYVWQEGGMPAQYQLFGSGCAGSLAQTPRLRPNPLWNSAPVLGSQFFVLVDQVPAGALVSGAIGFSNTTWNSTPLPFALDPFGMPGCELLVSPDAVVALGAASAAGTANWVTPIPATLSASGLTFFQQAFAIAPGANSAGVVVSNAGEGVVGN